MTNDKLPHGIEIKIDFDSNKFAEEHPKLSPHIAYRAGATAWAGWKVKFDELQAQAQRMADALEKIKTWHSPGHSAAWAITHIKNIAIQALQQFKDGTKGKEWQPIVTAPKDGSTIEVSYDKEGKEACLACWSEERICMAGPPMGCCGAGWATSPDSDTDTNLPLDPPLMWRPIN